MKLEAAALSETGEQLVLNANVEVTSLVSQLRDMRSVIHNDFVLQQASILQEFQVC